MNKKRFTLILVALVALFTTAASCSVSEDRAQEIADERIAAAATAAMPVSGPAGDPGEPGLHCWDLNENFEADPEEDITGNGIVDVEDCRGPEGERGEPGEAGPPGEDGADADPADVAEELKSDEEFVESLAEQLPELAQVAPTLGVPVTGTATLPTAPLTATDVVTSLQPLGEIVITEIFTQSVPNLCPHSNTVQQSITGEYHINGSTVWQQVAIGALGCVSSFEGRWYEGIQPDETHHVTTYMGPCENCSILQGSNWLQAVGTETRDEMFDLSIGKCENWLGSRVDPEPVQYDFLDEDGNLQALRTTCSDIAEWRWEDTDSDGEADLVLEPLENPLPEIVYAIPAELLPHWPSYTLFDQIDVNVFERADELNGALDEDVDVEVEEEAAEELNEEIEESVEEPAGVVVTDDLAAFNNVGKVCNPPGPVGLGDNAWASISPEWDPGCFGLADGTIDGSRTIGVFMLRDLEAARQAVDASLWVHNDETWRWMYDFAADNCPAESPIRLMYFDGSEWIHHEEFTADDC